MTNLDSERDPVGEVVASEAGTLADLATALEAEYSLCGYSIRQEEILVALINDFLFYLGWESSEKQKNGTTSVLDKNYIVHVNEWSVLDPVIRAHCELLQANLMEASRSLGMETFGLTVSEAKSMYEENKRELPKNAFVADYFVV